MSCSTKDLSRHAFRSLNRAVLPAVRAGIGSPLPIGMGLVILETTGRVSGQPRQVPLVATRWGDRVRVSTVRRSSLWAKNLEANENVSVWLNGRRRQAIGTVDSGSLTTATIALSH